MFNFPITFLALFSCFFLCACSDKGQEKTQKHVFHYNQISNVSSLDPAFARSQANMWCIEHLYNNLLTLDDSLHIQSDLAKRFEVSADGLTYTFILRDDVFFHDDSCFTLGKGRKMVAADIAYSFSRLLDLAVASPGSWIFKDKVDSIRPFEALNDTTFSLHLQRPFRPMLGILTMQYCAIVPREAVEYYKKDFRSHPVGTGAFRFKKWLENQGLFLLRNEHYFETDTQGVRLPYLDGVRVSFMPDRKTAYLEMMKGKIDFTSGIESSIVNELLTQDGELQPKHLGKLQLIKSPYLNTEYLGINVSLKGKDAPLSEKKVRQALNYGFDRVQMLQTLRNSMGKAATSGFAPRGLPSFSDSVIGYSYQPEKARQLLAAAGYPNGQGLPTVKLFCNKDYLDLCTFITRQWEELGVKAKVEVMETATLREMMTKGTAPTFRASWIADYPDAESFYAVFYGKNPAPPNYTRFQNAEFDAIYETALTENDDAQRYELYHQLDKITIDEAPVIFLFYDESSRFARANISGMSYNSMNLLPLTRVKKQ